MAHYSAITVNMRPCKQRIYTRCMCLEYKNQRTEPLIIDTQIYDISISWRSSWVRIWLGFNIINNDNPHGMRITLPGTKKEVNNRKENVLCCSE